MRRRKGCESPSPQQIHFWLRELRTPELLIELAAKRRAPRQLLFKRPLLKLAREAREGDLTEALLEEEQIEREADRQYWTPLKAELEKLRPGRSDF